MGRKAENVVTFNDQAIKKKLKEASGQPQREWRVEGSQGLILVTQPSGKGAFYLFYRNAFGKMRKLRLGEYGQDGITLHDARALAIEQRAKVEKGADPVADASALREALTFRELADRFLVENPNLAATTRKVYRYCLAKDAYPVIGDMPAESVTADHVVGICKRIEATGASVQSERTKTTIGGVYRWALRQRLAKANPCKDIGRRSHKVARKRTPTDKELAALWAATEDPASRLSRSMRLIGRLAILTGQRRTEVCGARVPELHLDGEGQRWVLPGDVNKRGTIIEGRTKNGREQVLPLSWQAGALFREAVKDCAVGEYVFPADMARVKIGKAPRTPHINGDSVTMAMRRTRQKLGIDDVSIHDMRRAISNWLKNEGVSREVRDLVLNHKDPSVTEEHYSSTARMERQVRQAMQLWADHIWEITGQGRGASNVVELKRA